MQAEKKQLEFLLLHYFKECYTDFPKGKIVLSESPDFVIRLKSKSQLGIELTRLNPENARIPNGLQIAEHSFRDHLVGFVKDLFEKSSPLKLFVKFHFSDEKKISSEREMSVAVQTAHIIRKIIQGQNTGGFFWKSIKLPHLPEGLYELLVIYHPALETSFWEQSNNLGISENVVDDIRKAILKKDEKLKIYQKKRLNN